MRYVAVEEHNVSWLHLEPACEIASECCRLVSHIATDVHLPVELLADGRRYCLELWAKEALRVPATNDLERTVLLRTSAGQLAQLDTLSRRWMSTLVHRSIHTNMVMWIVWPYRHHPAA